MSCFPSPSSSGKSPANGSATRSPPPRKRACGWAACRPWGTMSKTASSLSTTPRLASLSRSTGAISRSSRFTRFGKSLLTPGSRASAACGPTAPNMGVRTRGALYLILQNRLYRGEIPHKGNSYPGEHPAIIDKLLCDDVQAVLAANRVERTTGARASNPSLLTGMVFDETGERLTPTHAVKKGTRYRYYVSTSLLTGAGRTRSSGRRIPAGNLEGLVISRIRTFLAGPGAILDAVDQ